jgi:hypothetical protein
MPRQYPVPSYHGRRGMWFARGRVNARVQRQTRANRTKRCFVANWSAEYSLEGGCAGMLQVLRQRDHRRADLSEEEWS